MAAAKKPKAGTKAKKEPAKFELDGKVLEFDVDQLTFGEVEFIEEYFGVPLDMVPWESGRGSLVASFLALKRQDPDITLDDLRDMKISALKQGAKGAGDEGDRPTE